MDRSRLTLISMPWSSVARPSPALSALAAYVQRELPELKVLVRSEYVEVSQLVGEPYEPIADYCYRIGEALYGSLLYPERAEAVSDAFVDWVRLESVPSLKELDRDELRRMCASIRHELDCHADLVADEVSLSSDIVGLTCAFGQVFPSVLLARRIKQRNPSCLVVLGGSSVSTNTGPSLLSEYPCVDYVVQGEGERPLVALLRAWQGGSRLEHPSILGRDLTVASKRHFTEQTELDSLPLPDYSDYAGRAARYGIDWALPIEGSRGCWWDRTRKTGNPTQTCYFCNLNIQWNGYREKSVARIVEEVELQTSTYNVCRVFFVDNIIRKKGVEVMGRLLANTGRHLEIFYEARANLRPIELLSMWEAGLSSTQFGIEALVTSVLKRIGKGTSAIQNLEAMRLLAELEIRHEGNLIVNFPGSTEQEVTQTVRAIQTVASAYEPLTAVPFFLGRGATVEVLRERFGVANVRNRDWYRACLPDDVWERLQMVDLDYDLATNPVDWMPVRDAIAQWRSRFKGLHKKPLVYRDCIDFISIEDRREDILRSGTFDGLARAVYLECLETQRLSTLKTRFAHEDTASLTAILHSFVEDRLMAVEGDRYLSLAIATTPRLAAHRIRERAKHDPQAAAHRSLAVVQ